MSNPDQNYVALLGRPTDGERLREDPVKHFEHERAGYNGGCKLLLLWLQLVSVLQNVEHRNND